MEEPSRLEDVLLLIAEAFLALKREWEEKLETALASAEEVAESGYAEAHAMLQGVRRELDDCCALVEEKDKHIAALEERLVGFGCAEYEKAP